MMSNEAFEKAKSARGSSHEHLPGPAEEEA
jgi:hypothetical protein